jgi:hypothetical protein
LAFVSYGKANLVPSIRAQPVFINPADARVGQSRHVRPTGVEPTEIGCHRRVFSKVARAISDTRTYSGL